MADLIRLGQANTQADLTRITGFKRSTVSDSLRRLRRHGIIRTAGRRVRGRGKPATILRFDPGGFFAGIDIDGAHVHVALLDFEGNVLGSKLLGLEAHQTDPRYVLGLAGQTLLELQSLKKLRKKDLRATGLTVNAGLDADDGVLYSTVLPWKGVPLRDLARSILPGRVFVSSGVYHAVAEHRFGAGRGAMSILYFHVADGVSARLVVRGELIESRPGMASEIGHLVFDPDGPRCSCGKHGCLEAMIGGLAICRRILSDAPQARPGPHSELVRQAGFNAPIAVMNLIVEDAAANPNGYAAKLLGTLTALAGKALATAVACLAPERVVVGGYLFSERPQLLDRITHEAQERLGLGAALLPQVVPAALSGPGQLLKLLALVTDGLAHESAPDGLTSRTAP